MDAFALDTCAEDALVLQRDLVLVIGHDARTWGFVEDVGHCSGKVKD